MVIANAPPPVRQLSRQATLAITTDVPEDTDIYADGFPLSAADGD